MNNTTLPVCFIQDLQLSVRTLNRLQKQRSFRLRNTTTFERLSLREVEILTLICQGKTNEEIGQGLFRATNTIRTHRNNIWRRLGIRSVVEAVWWGECFDLV